jgi:hypothetical protein
MMAEVGSLPRASARPSPAAVPFKRFAMTALGAQVSVPVARLRWERQYLLFDPRKNPVEIVVGLLADD